MERILKDKLWLLIGALGVAAFVMNFLTSTQTIHPTGWDGYYYVMQIHSWRSFGYLQSPDYSLIYPYLFGIYLFIGDPILACNIGVALLSTFLTLAVCFYLKAREVLAEWVLVAGAYLLFSPVITYFLMQFPKNALGLILLIAFVNEVLLLQHSRSPKVIALAFVLLIATFMTHRMTGAFAIAIALLFSIQYLSWKLILSGGAVLVAVSYLPGVLHLSDLERLQGAVSMPPQWAPFSFYKMFGNSLHWTHVVDLIVITLLLVLSACLMIAGRDWQRNSIYWFLITVISLFPFLPFDAGSLGYRLFLVSPVAILLLLVPLVSAKLKARRVYILIPVILIAASFSFRSYRPSVFDPPNSLYSMVVEYLDKRFDATDYPLVIAHKSLAEMIIFATDFDALNWLPPDDIQPERVLRITERVARYDLRRYLTSGDYGKVAVLAPGYLAMPETTWQRFVTSVTSAGDTRVLDDISRGLNPMEVRPNYLNKGKNR